jgi:VWFA-related protein
MNKIPFQIFMGILLLGLAVAAPGAGPGANQDKSQTTLSHDVTVTLKLIQVYVVAKDGQPVTDLKLEDFELWDDGKLKPLTEFEAHSLSLGAAPVTPQAVQAPAPPAEKMSRKFFLFFDFAFNTLPGILESKNTALKFLDTQIRPEDEVGVISYHARKGLTLNEYLTTDHLRIRKTIEAIKPNAVTGRAADIGSYQESTSTMGQSDNILDSPGYEKMTSELSAVETMIYKHQVGDYLEQFTDLAKAIRYIPGTKSLLLFSSGIAHFLLYGKSDRSPEIPEFVDTGDPGVRTAFQIMCKALASSNCSIFPINVSGLSATPGRSLYRDDYMGDFALKSMAAESGGKYFDNVRNYEIIGAEIQNLTAAYYVLGYYINEKLDGDFHRVKVKVKRKGCEVHGQSGYFNPKPFTEYTENEKTLQLIDLALSEKPHLQEAVDFPLSVLPYSSGEKTDLVVLAGIPAAKLFEAAGGKRELITIVFNDKNDIVTLQRKELNRWPRASDEAWVKSLISLSPGQYECRTVIRNMTTGKGARGSSRITISNRLRGDKPALLQPLLLTPRKAAIYLGEEEAQKETRLWDIFPYDQNEYAPVMKDSIKAAAGLAAVIPFSAPPADEAAISFSASAVSLSSGESSEIAVTEMKWVSAGIRRAVWLKIDTAALKPGEHALYVSVGSPNSKRRVISAGTIKVE